MLTIVYIIFVYFKYKKVFFIKKQMEIAIKLYKVA